MYNVHLTPKSKNEKTGPIPVSTTTAATCPATCPFNNANEGGCYAAGGPLAMHWRKVTEGLRGMSWDAFCDAIDVLPAGQIWRHNQAGDLPGDGAEIDGAALWQLVDAQRGKRGFTYTHYPMTSEHNRAMVKAANANGFTVNLSANNLAHADDLADMQIAPVATVLPAEYAGQKAAFTPRGKRVVVCPATYRDDLSCADCQLCQRRDNRAIIGFPAHGSSAKRADKVASA